MHQNRSHHHHGTAEGSFTAKKWFGHRAGRSPCAHSIGKFFLCYIILLSSETSAPGSPGNYLYPTMLCYVLQCFTVLHYAPLCLPMLHCSLLFFTDFTFKKSARVKCTCKCVFLCLQYHICKTLHANFRGITHFCISLALFTVLVSTCSVRKL